jgi:hypothetical protein
LSSDLGTYSSKGEPFYYFLFEEKIFRYFRRAALLLNNKIQIEVDCNIILNEFTDKYRLLRKQEGCILETEEC